MEHASYCCPGSYLRSVDKDYPQGDFTGGDGLLLCTMASKSVMVFVFWSTQICTNIWYSAGEDAIITHIIRKNGCLKLPCSEPCNRMCVPDIGPFPWFVVHLGYVARFQPSGPRIVSRLWLFIWHQRDAVASGASGATSMFHCHSLACRSARKYMTHMFWWPTLGTKGRQIVTVYALVHCGRMSVLLESHRLRGQ
jgi:hypothetical protein